MQRRPLLKSTMNPNDDDDDSHDVESGEFHDIDESVEQIRERRRRRLELQRAEDALYEGEWGYSLIKALRGKTVGRRIRRKLFKFGSVQLFCGIALLVIAIEELKNFQTNAHMNSNRYGGSLEVNRC